MAQPTVERHSYVGQQGGPKKKSGLKKNESKVSDPFK